MRSRVLGVLVFSVAFLLLGIMIPGSALGLSASLEARAKASVTDATSFGVSAAAGATGTVDPGGDDPDPESVYLDTGDRLIVQLDAPVDTDFDLYLLWPGSADPAAFHIAAAAVTTTYPEIMTFDAAWPGTYSVAVIVASGSGDYVLDWTIEDAVSQGNMQRMEGLNRYLTAVDVSVNIFGETPSRDVVLASGASFPDSLTASGLAGTLGCPLLLTRPGDAPSYVVEELERIGVTDVHIVGGSAAVSDDVFSQLDGAGYDVYRYGGFDRYHTAALVAYAIDALSTTSPEYAFVARGDLFADALVVSPLAYARACPILLTRSGTLSSYAQDAILAIGIDKVVIAGGTRAISTVVEGDIGLLVGIDDVDRQGGRDRYETATLIAQMGIREYWATPEWTGVASGTNFPDAVCGGAGIGAQGGVLVLTKPWELSDDTSAFIASITDDGLLDEAVIFGGSAAVYPGVETELAEVIDQWRS